MRQMKLSFAAIASVLVSGTASFAADMPMNLPPPPVVTAPVETLSGWYVRGDIGYRFQDTGSVTSAIAPNPTNNRIDDAFAIGVGVGYKWSWFRTDITADYGFSSKYSGDTAGFTPDFTAKVQTTTVLANGYFDLGTWYGFTPYVGAGVGGAYVQTSDFLSASAPAAAVSSDRWNFAWAAMAGVSYCFTPNLILDIGYRYLDQGQVKTGLTSLGDQLTFKDLTAQEIRAGFRWAM